MRNRGNPRPVLILSAVLLVSLALDAAGQAGTIVPKIKDKGRPGDIARMQREKPARLFLGADTDGDNRVSLAEATEHLPYYGNNFARYDKNNDGELSWQEYLGHDRWPLPKREDLDLADPD